MAIDLSCPCGKVYQVKDELAGQRRKCPACNRVLVVPHPLTADLVPLEEPKDPVLAAEDRIGEQEEIRLAPLEDVKSRFDEEEDPGETYEVNRKNSGPSVAGLLGAMGGSGGALGCFKISRDRVAAHCLGCSGDCRYALAALDHVVFVLDVANGGIRRRFKRHENPVTCAALSPDGQLVLSGDSYGDLLLWEVETGREIDFLRGHRHAIVSVAFAANGRNALSGSRDGTMRLWDVNTGEDLDCFENKDGASIHCVAFSADGRLALAAGSGGTVLLWEVKSGRKFGRLRGAGGEITAAAFADEGRRVVAARHKRGSNRALMVWQWAIETGRPIPCFANPPPNQAGLTCMTLTPNGRRLLTAGAVTTSAGQPSGELLDRTMRAVSPAYRAVQDVRDIFTRQTSYYVYVLSVETGQVTQALEGHEGTIESLAVAPNGSAAISAAKDGTVRVWGLGL
jgi:WD40 repeat protein